MWRLFICGFSALLLTIGPAAAQGRIVHPYDRSATVPLDRILPHIRSAHPGTFSDVDGPFADPSGRLHYRIKWLTPDGRVVWLDADARNGQVLGVNRGWDGYGPYPRSANPSIMGVPEGPPPRYFRPGRVWGPAWRGRGHFGLGGFGGRGRRGR